MAQVIATPALRQRSRATLVAAVVFAALAAVLVVLALRERGDGGGGAAGAGNTVVVAARDVPANTTLTADMLRVQPIPRGAVLAGAYTALEGIVGLPTRIPLQAGEQLTPLKVGASAIGEEDDLALVLEPGKRALAVEVSEVTGVGGLLLPGNFVDVIAVFPEGPGRRAAQGGSPDLRDIKAVTLLQDVEVLAVGQEAQEPLPPVAGVGEDASGLRGQRPPRVERQPDARSVTLAVTPAQAELLALVQETGGAIWLSLRPAGDRESVPASDTNLLPLLSPPEP